MRNIRFQGTFVALKKKKKPSRFEIKKNEIKKERVDLDPQTSAHKGAKGSFEIFLRRYKFFAQILTLLPLYLMGSLCIGLALFPAVLFFRSVYAFSLDFEFFSKYLVLAVAIAISYFIYGFALLGIVPIVNSILKTNLKPWRGPYYSIEALNWYIHNGLVYLVRYTFLEFITPTPYNILFYKLMGMQIGQGVQINTSHISDPSLIELGDKVTIGGSVTIVAHYGQGGFLIIAPVKIEAGVTIGLKASVMGGVTIGEGAKVLPHSVVMPKTVIPAGEIWGGIPAKKIENFTSQKKKAS